MRFTNPVGTLGLRLTTSRAVPFWSGFGESCITGSLSHRPKTTALSAKDVHLKRTVACFFFPLRVNILACSLRLQTWSTNGNLRCDGEAGPTGAWSNPASTPLSETRVASPKETIMT